MHSGHESTPVLSPDVRDAQRAGRPIVALESSVLAQGLPVPDNREADRRMRSAIAARAAVPAVTAVVRGVPTIGLEGADLERFLCRDGIAKVSARDLPWAMVTRRDGATTVAASLALSVAAGIPVFATGGIGGVHRDAPYDESADLLELSRCPVVTVCAGAKSILDLHATVERLESLGVPVLGYRTGHFPGFFTARSGVEVAAVAETAQQVAETFLAQRALGSRSALLVVQAPPDGLDERLVAEAVDAALAAARDAGVRGAAVTPFLLAAVERATGGRTLRANLALLEANAALAAEIAVALAGLTA